MNKVKPPAIALIVFGVLAVLASLYGFLSPADPDKLREMFSKGDMPAETAETIVAYAGKFGILWNAVALALGAIAIVGGLNMLKLRNWGLAVSASVVAMIPCTCCCIVGLPIGIWALIVLLNNDVKAAFAAASAPSIPPPL